MIAEHVGGGGDDARVTPEFLARLDLIRARGHEMISAADTMRVTSEAGTDLTVRLAGAFTAGSTGVTPSGTSRNPIIESPAGHG